MRIILKDNYISINDNRLFIVVNDDGDLALEEKDNSTVVANGGETIIDLDLSKHEDKISFIGFVKFTYDKITYTSYFFLGGKGLLSMITHLPSGVIAQCREIGLEFPENESDIIIKFNNILTEKDRKLIDNIIYNPSTWDEVLNNIVHVYPDKEFGPYLIKLDSKFYVLRGSEDIREIFIDSVLGLTSIGAHAEKISKLDFIELLFNNKDKIQCRQDTDFGFYYTPQQLPDDIKSLNVNLFLYLNRDYNTCYLTCVPKEPNHNVLEIPILDIKFDRMKKLREDRKKNRNKTIKLEL